MKPLPRALFIFFLLLPAVAFAFEDGSSSASISRSCLTCHDGTIAQNIATATSGPFTGQVAAGGGHSVGMDYALAQIRSRGKLKPLAVAEAAVQFENGQVGCTSCHNPASRLRFKLVMDNAGSRLCYSCHDL